MFKVHMKEEKKYYLDDNISLIKRHAGLIRNTNWVKNFFYERMGIIFNNKQAYMDGFVNLEDDKIYRLVYPGTLGKYSVELVFSPKYPYYGYVYEVFLTIWMSVAEDHMNGSTLMFNDFRNYASLENVKIETGFERIGCRNMLMGLINTCFKRGNLNMDQDLKLQRLLLEIM